MSHTFVTIADNTQWAITRAISTLDGIPGSAVVVRYVHSSYQNDPVRSVFELGLVLFAIYYILAPTYNPKKSGGNHVRLTENEIDELVDEWTPEPLVADNSELSQLDRNLPIFDRDAPAGPKMKLKNHGGKMVTNLASYNHYNFSQDSELVDEAVQTIRTYGVGPCSAPGFYGTFDVHMGLEQQIASHFGTEKAIVYSQSFSTISAMIPAFCKRGDIIVADRAVNFPILKGIQASRANVRWYKHNDMEDLECVLSKIVSERRPLTRRFIVTEGLSENVGDMVDLPKLLELKRKYKFRVLLDETWSYGIVGRTGRGVTEHYGISATQVDAIVGSLAGCMSSGGGFCTGPKDMVEHQRLNASAFTYSASLCAFLASTASKAIVRLQSPDGILAVQTLQDSVKALRLQLQRSDWVECTSAAENPVLLLAIKGRVIQDLRLSRSDQEFLLQDCVDEVSTFYV